ncbi:MAG: inositol monophosphatase [Candidatus Taylorbacteria bacterium]|nr:inositol monophosphatase [Candidatus Taylorbacteria bacterium]
MENYKVFATDIALRAGKIMLNNFSLGMIKEWKADCTPLTATDTSINSLVVAEIRRNFPGHALLGEEESNMHECEYVWVCDPIDGTTGFSHGYPIFMFQLALTRFGESVLGVMYDPVLQRMFYAEKGKGSFLNGRPIHVSKDVSFSDKTKKSIICIDGDEKAPLIFLRNKLREKGAYTTAFYCASYPSALIACGEFIGEVYGATNAWDGATVKIIVEEAGGKVTDLFGKEQRYDKPINGFVATNGLIHDELIEIIKSLFFQSC